MFHPFLHRLRRYGGCGLLALLLLAASPAPAADLPASVCASGAGLDYPPPGGPPAGRIFHEPRSTPGGIPGCAGFHGNNFTLFLALSGTMRPKGGAEDILSRFGKISALQQAHYWSVSGGRWQDLIGQATALSDADPAHARGDFAAGELKPGRDLYFLQKPGHAAGGVLFRLRVLEASDRKLAVFVENANKISFLMIPLFKPGDVQMVYIFDRQPDGSWRYRNLWGVAESRLAAAGNHDASYLNRADAMFHYLAGLPTDRDPPLARRDGVVASGPRTISGPARGAR